MRDAGKRGFCAGRLSVSRKIAAVGRGWWNFSGIEGKFRSDGRVSGDAIAARSERVVNSRRATFYANAIELLGSGSFNEYI